MVPPKGEHASHAQRKREFCALSKLNCPVSVPTCFPTVIAVRLVPPRYNAGEHATAVTVDHEELVHSTDSSSDAEGLGSIEAKLSPVMDTDTPPVCAAFAGLMLLTAGAAHTEQRSWYCTSHGAQRRKRPYHRS
jgi:hypothetical protein